MHRESRSSDFVLFNLMQQLMLYFFIASTTINSQCLVYLINREKLLQVFIVSLPKIGTIDRTNFGPSSNCSTRQFNKKNYYSRDLWLEMLNFLTNMINNLSIRVEMIKIYYITIETRKKLHETLLYFATDVNRCYFI